MLTTSDYAGAMNIHGSDIGATVKRLADERGMELQTLAFALGVSPQTVSRWVNGRSDIPTAQALRIAAMFQVAPELLGVDAAFMEQPAPAWADTMRGDLLGEMVRLNDLLLEELKRLRAEVHALKG